MAIAKVEIICDAHAPRRTVIKVNGHELKGVRALALTVGVDSPPLVTLTMVAGFSIEGTAEVVSEFAKPSTPAEALDVRKLVNELRKPESAEFNPRDEMLCGCGQPAVVAIPKPGGYLRPLCADCEPEARGVAIVAV